MSRNSSESKTSPHSWHSTNSVSSSRATTRTFGCLQRVFMLDVQERHFRAFSARFYPCRVACQAPLSQLFLTQMAPVRPILKARPTERSIHAETHEKGRLWSDGAQIPGRAP